MKMKRIAIAVGAAAGLSIAAPAWVIAAGTQSGEDSYQSQSGMGQESADTAAMEQQAGGQDLMQMQVSELEGKTVKNQNGEDLGKVEKIVKDKQDHSLHAVISTGGFLGVGAKRVTIPVDQLKLQDGNLVASISESPEQFQQQMAYNEADYDPVDSNQQLAQASGISPGQGEIASFEQLDTDQSGAISRDEAQTQPKLSDNWSQYDLNADDQIDQSEFSAFEQESAAQQPKGEIASFEELDVDQNGAISRDEVQAYADLLNQWDQYDTNADDQLDQAEFSAFEQSLGEDTGGQDTGAQPSPMSDQSAMEPQGEAASFDSLDSDKNGYISQQEAQQDEALSRNWQDVDVNADNQVDQAEFSAFESGLSAPGQPGMEGKPGAMESPQSAPGTMGTE